MTTRYWCFTSYEQLKIDSDKKDFGYCIYGEEICPKTGKTHYQGYIEFKRAVSMNVVKLRLGVNTVHCEQRMGTQDQAINYCKKDNKYVEIGEKFVYKQGERTDLSSIATSSREGVSVKEMVDMGMINNYQQLRFAEGLQKYVSSSSRDKPYVEWIYGPTGTGKTKKVYEEAPDAYWTEPNLQWFDGYVGQEDVIIDEFRGQVPLNFMLRLLDRYPLSLPVKGSFISWKPKRIYITSCFHPSEVYKNCSENIQQLIRRIDKIHKTDFS